MKLAVGIPITEAWFPACMFAIFCARLTTAVVLSEKAVTVLLGASWGPYDYASQTAHAQRLVVLDCDSSLRGDNFALDGSCLPCFAESAWALSSVTSPHVGESPPIRVPTEQDFTSGPGSSIPGMMLNPFRFVLQSPSPNDLRKIGDTCNSYTECESSCCLIDDPEDEESLPTCQKMGGRSKPCNFSTTDDEIYDTLCPCEPSLVCTEGMFPVVSDNFKFVEVRKQRICLPPRTRRPTTESEKTTEAPGSWTENGGRPLGADCRNSTQCLSGCCVFNLSTGNFSCQNLGNIASECDEREVENVYVDRCPCIKTLRCFSGNFVSGSPTTTRRPIKVCVSTREAHRRRITKQTRSSTAHGIPAS